MLTKLPLALALLLSASILAAAELRTGVPYYMAPLNWTLGGGVAPKRVGIDVCPSAVKLTPEGDRGLPIIFTSPSHPEESVVINENTDVLISFNHTVCGERTWANPILINSPPELPLGLVGKAVILTWEGTRFRIKKEGISYKLYSIKNMDGVLQQYGDGVQQHYNLVSRRDTGKNSWHLDLSRVLDSVPVILVGGGKGYSRMINPVF